MYTYAFTAKTLQHYINERLHNKTNNVDGKNKAANQECKLLAFSWDFIGWFMSTWLETQVVGFLMRRLIYQRDFVTDCFPFDLAAFFSLAMSAFLSFSILFLSLSSSFFLCFSRAASFFFISFCCFSYSFFCLGVIGRWSSTTATCWSISSLPIGGRSRSSWWCRGWK